MTGEIGADFGRLEATHSHLVSSAAKMNASLADLKRYLAPMVASWEGDAATNYQVLQAKWDQAASDLNTTLQRIGAALGDTNVDFQSTERANAARF